VEVVVHKKSFFVNDEPYWSSVSNGVWEPQTFNVFDKFIDSTHSIIDIGAWIGPTTLYGCQLAKHCHAIEPDPVAFKKLKYNVALNPTLQSKISLYNTCLSSETGKARFFSASTFGDSRSSLVLKESDKSVEVDSITLEDLMRQNNITDCNFIKMDVEGSELVILPNIRDYLKREKPTLYLSLHHFLFRDRKNYAVPIILTLEIYKDILNMQGQKVSLQDILDFMAKDPGKGCEIVATDRIVWS
jgi:FkbM family methyltransferase